MGKKNNTFELYQLKYIFSVDASLFIPYTQQKYVNTYSVHFDTNVNKPTFTKPFFTFSELCHVCNVSDIKMKIDEYMHTYITRTQSYDIGFYNYNASVVVS
jgi:hypothetical protein